MAVNLKEAVARLCAIEEAYMTSISVAADAVPRFWHTQEAFPYLTHRVGTMTVGDEGEELDTYAYDITIRLVIGHITQGYVGENDDKLQTWLPGLIEYINEREGLQSADYPDALDDLMRARVRGATGYVVFVNSALGSTTQAGTEITVRLEFWEDIEQAYA